jgi:antitoxin component YwqK of YwqJK toxin-antitoxin module
MKKIKLLIVLLSVVFSVNAETIKTQKNIVCSTLKEVEAMLNNTKQEEVWTGYSPNDKTLYTFFYNKESKEWLIFQYDDKIACLIGHGSGSIKDEQEQAKMVDINGR